MPERYIKVTNGADWFWNVLHIHVSNDIIHSYSYLRLLEPVVKTTIPVVVYMLGIGLMYILLHAIHGNV